jgi:hypothetical protein
LSIILTSQVVGPRLRQFAFAGDPVFVLALLYAKPVPIFVEDGTHSEKFAKKQQKMTFFGVKMGDPRLRGDDDGVASLSIRNAPVSGKKQGTVLL